MPCRIGRDAGLLDCALAGSSAAAVCAEESVGKVPFAAPGTGSGHRDLDPPDTCGEQRAEPEQAQPDGGSRDRDAKSAGECAKVGGAAENLPLT